MFVKHQGKKYEVELDPTSTGETFKYQLYSLTGVEPDRQKILVKGGQLKDETELSKLGAKPGQTFMMMGTPAGDDGILIKPKGKMMFMEDMTDAEAAQQEGAMPAGLQNLGNTCYMNSTLQTLRAVPELQEQLFKYTGGSSSSRVPDLSQFTNFGLPGNSSVDITSSLRDLYKQMSQTQEGFPPLMFLSALQTTFPQFAEKSKTGHGYAQQDAEEAWTQILSQLRQKLKTKALPAPSASSSAQDPRDAEEISVIDKYLAGRFSSTLTCDEPAAIEAGEAPTETSDVFLKLDCHIEKETSHLRDGILKGLTEKIEKKSPTLDCDALYTKTSRISRLPKYLTVHFVRFFWRRDIRKKTKIMKKVTFPAELDVVEFCTETLQKQLVPVRDKVREVRKDEEDVNRARKRQKLAHKQEEDRAVDEAAKAKAQAPTSETKPAPSSSTSTSKTSKSNSKPPEPEPVYKTDAEFEAEQAASVLAAKKDLYKLISPDLLADDGCNASGLYELRGVVTHQGASADSGHYTAYVKKQGALDKSTGKRKEEDGKWWWFNDEKVSEVEAERIEGLSGGGKSQTASFPLSSPSTCPVFPYASKRH